MTLRDETREAVSRLIERAKRENDNDLVTRLQWVINFLDGNEKRPRFTNPYRLTGGHR